MTVKEMEKQAWECENSKGIEASGHAASLDGFPGYTQLCTTLAKGHGARLRGTISMAQWNKLMNLAGNLPPQGGAELIYSARFIVLV